MLQCSACTKENRLLLPTFNLMISYLSYGLLASRLRDPICILSRETWTLLLFGRAAVSLPAIHSVTAP